MYSALICLMLCNMALVAGKAVENGACPKMDECPLNCMFGYAVNKDGCEVCECQNTPCSESGDNCQFAKKVLVDEKDCKETNTCNIIPKAGVCPDQTCQTFCKFGFMNGQSGCPICKCNPDPCKNVQCDGSLTCVPTEEKCQTPPCQWTGKCSPSCPMFECMKECNFGYKKDKNGCKTCECAKDICEDVKCSVNQVCVYEPKSADLHTCECEKKTCDLTCPFGLARDANGCQTCKCVKDPCESVSCQNEQLSCLSVQDKVCLEKPCPFKPRCLPKN